MPTSMLLGACPSAIQDKNQHFLAFMPTITAVDNATDTVKILGGRFGSPSLPPANHPRRPSPPPHRVYGSLPLSGRGPG